MYGVSKSSLQDVSIDLDSCQALEDEKDLPPPITLLVGWNYLYLISVFHCLQVVSLKQINMVSYNKGFERYMYDSEKVSLLPAK